MSFTVSPTRRETGEDTIHVPSGINALATGLVARVRADVANVAGTPLVISPVLSSNFLFLDKIPVPVVPGRPLVHSRVYPNRRYRLMRFTHQVLKLNLLIRQWRNIALGNPCRHQ